MENVLIQLREQHQNAKNRISYREQDVNNCREGLTNATKELNDAKELVIELKEAISILEKSSK